METLQSRTLCSKVQPTLRFLSLPLSLFLQNGSDIKILFLLKRKRRPIRVNIEQGTRVVLYNWIKATTSWREEHRSTDDR